MVLCSALAHPRTRSLAYVREVCITGTPEYCTRSQGQGTTARMMRRLTLGVLANCPGLSDSGIGPVRMARAPPSPPPHGIPRHPTLDGPTQ
jgi:hypothetical protein